MLLLIVYGLILMGFRLSNRSSREMFASEKQVRARSRSHQSPVPLDSFRLLDIDGRPVDLKTFKDNSVVECKHAKYAGLQDIYERYRDRGFEVVAFPANDFG